MLLDELLDENLTPEIEKDIAVMIATEVRRSHEAVKGRKPPERVYLLPHLRRTNIETGLVEVAERHAGKLQVRIGRTEKNHYYRVLIAGKVLLTESYVDDDRRVPNPADFRNDLAEDPAQFRLHPADEDERQRTIKAVKANAYLIITYTLAEKDAGAVHSINIVLVDKDCAFKDSRDLLARIANRASKKSETEVIPDTITIKRKAAQKRKDKGGAGA
jgi:hypothetical protein